MDCRSNQYFITGIWTWFCLILAANIGFAATKGTHGISGNNIFIKAVASKSNVYVNEAFTVKYLLYLSKDIIDPQTDIDIKFKDCYTEAYPGEPEPDELINGKRYHVRSLKKILVIPQFEGSIDIPVISVQLKVQATAKDDFFETGKLITREIRSQSGQINVLPLPPYEGTSVPFTGAVGNFVLDSRFIPSAKSPNELKLEIRIAGTGDLKFMHWSPPIVAAGINVFNIINKEADKLSKETLVADHLFSFEMLSNYRGEFTIPKITFTAFDPDSGKYITYETRPYHWIVRNGPKLPAFLTAAGSGTKALFVKRSLYNSSTADQETIGNYINFFLVFSGLIFFVIGRMNLYRTRDRYKNPARYNFRNAKKRAVAKIKKLQDRLEIAENGLFSKNIDDIWQAFIYDKIGVIPQESSVGHIRKKLVDSGAPVTVQAAVIKFVDSQYKKRFSAAAGAPVNREKECLELIEIVENLDIYIK